MVTVGAESAIEFGEVALGCLTAAVALGAAMAGRQLRELNERPDPVPPAAAEMLPPRRSLARPLIERLRAGEERLDVLLRELRQQVGDGASAVEDQVRPATEDSARLLRRAAVRLVAIEDARDDAPPLARDQLIVEVHRLSHALHAGVEGYWQLTAVAGRAVTDAEVGGPAGLNPVLPQLMDSIDHLEGLAAALRELGGPGPTGNSH